MPAKAGIQLDSSLRWGDGLVIFAQRWYVLHMQTLDGLPYIAPIERERTKHVRVGLLFAEVKVVVEISGVERKHRVLPDGLEKMERVRKALEAGDVNLAQRDAEVFRMRPLN
jgi:hypothetical protein